VFSLKQPLFSMLRKSAGDAQSLADLTWSATTMLDRLGLYTMEIYQKTRDEVIVRQQQEMLELSTPVVTLWDGVLALPLIGTLDSARTQIVMESLLQRIVDTGSAIAILDITGVPTVDTLVAQHLLKTVAAARLMGADCIISGIRPQIAQTIVHLGVDLNSVTTKATLADAFSVALKRAGLAVTRSGAAGRPAAGSGEPPIGASGRV
jgi:rsbT co-antagonist protein RsbR